MIIGLLLFLFVTFAAFSQNMEIEVNGNITFDNSMFTITEAGNDFPASVENTNSVYVSLLYSSFWDKIFSPNRKWRINIQKADLIWDPNLTLEIIRSGDGVRPWRGGINIHDGISYQTITNTPTYFFRGKNEVNTVPLDFKLSGVSVTMGATNFETNILLTVYDD